jgi:hypothetical protein
VVNIKHSLIILLSIALLSGCEQIFAVKNYVKSFFHEEVVFFYTSTDYPDKLTDDKSKDLRQRTLVFGPYMPNIGSGGGFGGNYHPYKGPMEGEEIVAFWRMPLKQQTVHYYVRSEPSQGIIRAPRDGRRAYHVGVALGPMRTGPTGLTDYQFGTAQIAHENNAQRKQSSARSSGRNGTRKPKKAPEYKVLNSIEWNDPA